MEINPTGASLRYKFNGDPAQAAHYNLMNEEQLHSVMSFISSSTASNANDIVDNIAIPAPLTVHITHVTFINLPSG